MRPSAAGPLDRRTAFGAALIALAALGVYGWTVGFDFVFDDHIQIERNPWLRDPDGFRLFLTRPFWGFYHDRGPGPSNYYRPAFGIFYSLLARVFGLQPAAFHAASVLLHLGVSLLVALGARRLVGADAAALAAGLLFAVHPAHAEAVAWVGGQADLLMALFSLMALLAYLTHKDGSALRRRAAVAGPLAYLLACLSKEPGAALILVLGAVEAAEWRREGPAGAALRRAAARLLPYLAVLAVYAALRVHALGGFAPRHYSVTSSPAGALAFAGALLARYLVFLVFPFPARVLAWVPTPSLLSPDALAGLLVITLALLGLAVAVWSGRARWESVTPLAVVVAFLLPALAANSIGGANFAERYLYLPSAGLAWLAGLLWSRLAGALRTASMRRTILAAALGGLAAAGAAAGIRAGIYCDDLSLFQAAVRVTPRSEIAHNNLGMALYREGRLDEAEREYREALRLNPGSVPSLANLGILLERRGDVAGAKAAFEETLRRSPAYAAAALHLARFQIKEGDRAGAARRLDALFAAGGESHDALVERADLYLQEGRPGAAIPLLEKAVRAFPKRERGRELLTQARRESRTPPRDLRGRPWSP
ncbi:MAG TPA: tetratricopeptide repeat protein [Thermoanaerobaculia bacterium]|jgi:tetratricopeptide (TPR) repeat protein